MEKFLERVLKLLEVKSIVTITLVMFGCYGFIKGSISGEVFAGWVGMIMVYFFNKEKQ